MWVGFSTNGFEAGEEGTSFFRSVSVSVAEKDGKKPSAASYGATRFQDDLPTPGFLGQDATGRALAQIGSSQIPTGRYDLVIENRAVSTLASYVLSALTGSALQQKRSFLEGLDKQPFASNVLTIISDPHLPRGHSSSAWDSEGMATEERMIIDQGAVQTFFLDTYYASKLQMAPTTSDMANLVWTPGTRDRAAMIKSVTNGILVTGFLGGNSNATTGDFSLGIRGFHLKNGRPAKPVSEMNIAGNHLEFWKSLKEVGNDPWTYSSNRTPTLRFGDVQCSGSES